MSTGRVVGIVLGSLVALSGLGMILGGGGVLVAERVLADAEGYVTMRPTVVRSDGYAIVAPADFRAGPWFWLRHEVTLRLRVSPQGAAAALFVGLASRADVDNYLQGVSRAEITERHAVRGDRKEPAFIDVREIQGSGEPAVPSAQPFWLTSATGTLSQTLTWRIEPSDVAVVLMNADATSGVDASVSLAARAPILLTLAGVVLGVGVAIFLLGALVVILCARRSSAVTRAGDDSSPSISPQTFPLTLRADPPGNLSPLLWLVKGLLLIPHAFVLGFLWAGFVVSWGISWIAILLTGRYPRGLFDFNVGVLRWTWRVGYYGYLALATDEYPPFSLRAGGYPADLDVPYPAALSRRIAFVKWWLLAVPHYLVVGLLVGGTGFAYGGLVFLLALYSGVALLFTGRYPEDLFRLVVGANRWALRVAAYVALMTDVYPPFRLDA
ncbi:MAG: DUF4389 domain-containing protein [Candidatus Bipolaricaulota bacterium]